MKPLLIAMFLLAPLAAQAASSEESYLSARDQYTKTFNQIETWSDSTSNQHQAALDDLEKQLRKILGPFVESGFSAEGKINLDTLVPSDEGYGVLDGLAYSSTDERTRIVVTSDTLFTHWLKEHENWWDGYANVPQEVDAALQSEVFYTQAISTDAAVTEYAAIPIAKPAKAKFAFAMLAGRSQDIVPMVPDEVMLSVVTDHRVFVVIAPAASKTAGIPACDLVWQDFQKRADQAYTAYTNSNPQDDKLFDAYTQIQEEGSGAFGRCYNERAPHEAFFAALVKQAQAIADDLPAE